VHLDGEEVFGSEKNVDKYKYIILPDVSGANPSVLTKKVSSEKVE
jgi:hypothetical protein